jgi:hypothetical protein
MDRKGEDAQYLIPDRLEELLEDQTESSSRGMVQRIWKTGSTLSTTTKATENLGSRDSNFEKIYRLNK